RRRIRRSKTRTAMPRSGRPSNRRQRFRAPLQHQARMAAQVIDRLSAGRERVQHLHVVGARRRDGREEDREGTDETTRPLEDDWVLSARQIAAAVQRDKPLPGPIYATVMLWVKTSSVRRSNELWALVPRGRRVSDGLPEIRRLLLSGPARARSAARPSARRESRSAAAPRARTPPGPDTAA